MIRNRISGRSQQAFVVNVAAAALLGLTIAAGNAQAQQALGVPLAGKNNLSLSVTELSRDGIGEEKTAVYGGIYGRRLSEDNSRLQFSVIVRTAVRALEKVSDEGIVDAGMMLAATYRLNALSITGATGGSAVVWGQKASPNGPDRGRIVAREAITGGAAYDIKLGSAVVSPFVSYTGAWSSERDYLNDVEVSKRNGWRYNNSAGVSLRFRETVLTLSEINRERGMPNRNRVMFTAGMTW